MLHGDVIIKFKLAGNNLLRVKNFVVLKEEQCYERTVTSNL